MCTALQYLKRGKYEMESSSVLEAGCLQGQSCSHIDIIFPHRLLKDGNGALTQPLCLLKPADQLRLDMIKTFEHTSASCKKMQCETQHHHNVEL